MRVPALALLVLALGLHAAPVSAAGQRTEVGKEPGGGVDEAAPSSGGSKSGQPPAKKYTGPGLGRGVMDVPSSQTARPSARRTAIDEARRLAQRCSRVRQAEIEVDRGRARRTHDPELDGSHCIELEEREGLYGRGFRNVCDFTVVFSFCNYRPDPDSWAASFDCETDGGGTEILLPKRRTAAHTATAEWIYWAGCRHPEGSMADRKFRPGIGYEYRCHAWGSPQQAEMRYESSQQECSAEEQMKDALAREAQAAKEAQEAERQRRLTAQAGRETGGGARRAQASAPDPATPVGKRMYAPFSHKDYNTRAQLYDLLGDYAAQAQEIDSRCHQELDAAVYRLVHTDERKWQIPFWGMEGGEEQVRAWRVGQMWEGQQPWAFILPRVESESQFLTDIQFPDHYRALGCVARVRLEQLRRGK